jgi:hypothetical protein
VALMVFHQMVLALEGLLILVAAHPEEFHQGM